MFKKNNQVFALRFGSDSNYTEMKWLKKRKQKPDENQPTETMNLDK